MFAAQKPIVFGPNGSGYKGKDKSHQNYAATSAMYDFRGSYTQRGRGRGGQPPDDDSDADEEDKPPRRGGPGGGRGPPNGEPAANPKKEKMLKGKGKGSKAYSEWFWACVSFICFI
jgi:hypothetical protein